MEQKQEIDLKELFDNFIKKWWLIISLMMIFAVVSYMITEYIIDPNYQSNTTLFIGNEQNDIELGLSLNDLRRDSGLIGDYQSIAKTRLIIDSVLNTLNIEMPIEDFRKGMTIQTIDDSRLFVVSFVSKSPELSAAIANELAKQLTIAAYEIVGVENIRILDKAIINYEAISPSKLKNTILGGLIGWLIGMTISLILFVLNDTISSKADVSKILKSPIIGDIPLCSNKVFNRNQMRIITHIKPNSYIAECYKILRSNVGYLSMESKSRIIMFTSSTAGEGKTTSASNLAVSFAKDGKNVLLVDADLRRPNVHSIFNLQQFPGMTNMFFKKVSFTSVINKIDGIANLDVLTTGVLPPSPDELLGSKQFRQFLLDAKQEYDYIIVDAPPVLVVSDAIILSKIVDEVILVAAVKETKIQALKNAEMMIKQVDANLVGTVLTKNKIKKNDSMNHYYNDDLKQKRV